VSKKPNSAQRKTKALQSFDEFQGWKLNVTRITKEGHKVRSDRGNVLWA
jgi:hypothetical protein